MDALGNPYLGEEVRAADALAVTYLNEVESSGCRALVTLLAERLRDSAEDAWTPWLHEHPVSTERIEALPCRGQASTSRRFAASPGGARSKWTEVRT
jgi:predicted Zn-dependent protease